MNIGIFTETYLPDTNGVVVSLLRFRKQLEAAGHKVFVFAPGRNLKFSYSSKELVWLFPAIGSLGGGVLRLALPIARAEDFKKFKLDIVHTYTPGPMGILGIVVAKKLKLPLVHTFHTFVEEYTHYLHINITKGGARQIMRWAIKRFLMEHDAIIVPSSAIAKYVASFKLNKPIHVIPTGIDVDEIEKLSCGANLAKILRKLGISNNDSFLLSAGRLGKEKNFGFLLRAMAEIRKSHPETKLVIAGEGPERKHLENEAVELGIKPNVLLPGIIKQEDLFCLLGLAKVFVFASLTETQGLVTMEAMALGVPVVAVKARGTEDILAGNKGGFMVKENVKVFAGKVNQLLDDDKLRKKKGAEARRRASDFSMRKMAEKLISVYKNLIVSAKANVGH